MHLNNVAWRKSIVDGSESNTSFKRYRRQRSSTDTSGYKPFDADLATPGDVRLSRLEEEFRDRKNNKYNRDAFISEAVRIVICVIICSVAPLFLGEYSSTWLVVTSAMACINSLVGKSIESGTLRAIATILGAALGCFTYSASTLCDSWGKRVYTDFIVLLDVLVDSLIFILIRRYFPNTNIQYGISTMATIVFGAYYDWKIASDADGELVPVEPWVGWHRIQQSALERSLMVVAGVGSSMLVTVFIFPITAKDTVRRGISNILQVTRQGIYSVIEMERMLLDNKDLLFEPGADATSHVLILDPYEEDTHEARMRFFAKVQCRLDITNAIFVDIITDRKLTPYEIIPKKFEITHPQFMSPTFQNLIHDLGNIKDMVLHMLMSTELDFLFNYRADASRILKDQCKAYGEEFRRSATNGSIPINQDSDEIFLPHNSDTSIGSDLYNDYRIKDILGHCFEPSLKRLNRLSHFVASHLQTLDDLVSGKLDSYAFTFVTYMRMSEEYLKFHDEIVTVRLTLQAATTKASSSLKKVSKPDSVNFTIDKHIELVSSSEEQSEHAMEFLRKMEDVSPGEYALFWTFFWTYLSRLTRIENTYRNIVSICENMLSRDESIMTYFGKKLLKRYQVTSAEKSLYI